VKDAKTPDLKVCAVRYIIESSPAEVHVDYAPSVRRRFLPQVQQAQEG